MWKKLKAEWRVMGIQCQGCFDAAWTQMQMLVAARLFIEDEDDDRDDKKGHRASVNEEDFT